MVAPLVNDAEMFYFFTERCYTVFGEDRHA